MSEGVKALPLANPKRRNGWNSGLLSDLYGVRWAKDES